MKKRSLISTWCLAYLALTPACGSDDEPAEPGTDSGTGTGTGTANDAASAGDDDAGSSELVRMVGAVDDSDIRLGVVVEGARARLFFCGGDSSYSTATRWIVVPLKSDGRFDYDELDWRVTGRVDSSGVEGTWHGAEDESHAFGAEPVRSGTLAGLYEGMAECGRLGLIVTQNARGDEASGQGACVGMGHLPEQVHPILPISQVGGQIRVEVSGAASGLRPAGSTM